jgi:CheY-like chemotaxis protein
MLTSTEHAYRVLTARDGQEALNILQDCRPAAILLDLVMPKMDKIDALLTGRRQVDGTPTWVWWALAGTVALGAGMFMMRGR